MHVLYEEDGAFRTASYSGRQRQLLAGRDGFRKAQQDQGGQRSAALRRTGADALLEQAEALAARIEQEFLWECLGDGEFSFADFANDYFGHVATAVEASALLLALHSAPVYFHRKGKGRFRKAPPKFSRPLLRVSKRSASKH
jgi:exoribonuclease-2